MSEDESSSVELTPHAEFVVGALDQKVKGHEKQLDKLENNFEHLQVSIADQFNDLSQAGADRETTILKAIDDNTKTINSEWQTALTDDQDAREATAEAKTLKKEEFLAEKKRLRNKILVVVVSSLIISAIGFTAMIVWLGFKTYLKQELTINQMKEEINENARK